MAEKTADEDNRGKRETKRRVRGPEPPLCCGGEAFLSHRQTALASSSVADAAIAILKQQAAPMPSYGSHGFSRRASRVSHR